MGGRRDWARPADDTLLLLIVENLSWPIAGHS
jgi:hypothetical protein